MGRTRRARGDGLSARLQAGLRDLAGLGDYFVVTDGFAAGWTSLREFLADTAAMTARVERTQAALARGSGDVDLRVAASIDSLGVVSRLVSPALGVACRVDLVPRLHPDRVRWRPGSGGAVRLAWAPVEELDVATAAEAAVALDVAVLQPVVLPVADAYRATFGVSAQTLRGNVASALHGAATMLGAGSLDPHDIVRELVRRPVLAGSAEYRGDSAFVRTNCCWFYRVPGGGLCGDCVLTRRR